LLLAEINLTAYQGRTRDTARIRVVCQSISLAKPSEVMAVEEQQAAFLRN
jgi:hypothetical protein